MYVIINIDGILDMQKKVGMMMNGMEMKAHLALNIFVLFVARLKTLKLSSETMLNFTNQRLFLLYLN